MVQQHRNFCWTLNNPTAQETAHLCELAEDLEAGGEPETVTALVFQEEEGAAGTTHYQGCIVFKAKKSFLQVKEVLGSARAHVERMVARPDIAFKYCRKEESRVDGGIYADVDNRAGQGARTDMDQVLRAIDDGTRSELELFRTFGETYMRNKNHYDRYLELIRAEENSFCLGELRPWQGELNAELSLPPDDRKIYWVYDREGGAGKTAFAKHLVAQRNAFYARGGKAADVLHGYQGQRIVILDYVRDAETFVNYGCIEALKDGLVYKTKYNSGMCIYDIPHVIVMANFECAEGKFSRDRIVRIEVSSNA